MERHKVLGVAAAAGLAVTLVSACGGGGGHSGGLSLGSGTTTGGGSNGGGGGSSADASAAVVKAVTKLGNEQGIQLGLHMDGQASAFGSNSDLTTSQQQAILNSRVLFAVNTGNGKSLVQDASSANTASNTPGGDVQIALTNKGANLGTLEVINGKTAYARVDIHQFTDTYGLDQGSVQQFESELQQASSQVPGLSALQAGKWVSVDLAPLLQLEQQSGGSSSSGNMNLSPATAGKVISGFLQAFEHNSTVTKTGSALGGTEYQAVVKEKGFASSFGQTIQSIPGLGADATGMTDNNIPANQTLTLNIVVKNGEVSEVELPLNQFDTNHELNGPITLGLDVAPTGAISAPSGATPVDISQFLGDLGEGSSSSSSSSGSGF